MYPPTMWNHILATVVLTLSFAALPLTAQATDRPEPTSSESASASTTFDRLGVEEAEGRARASLVTGQTIHGIALGAQTCALIECESPRPIIGLPTLGAGAGLGLSLLATQDRGITPGHAAAINFGTLWGVWSSSWMVEIADIDDRDTALAMRMAGQLFGTAGGHFLANSLRPISGDVFFVNSGAAWALAYYVGINYGLLEREPSTGRQASAEVLAVSTVGGITGGILARESPMSSSRLGIINASGLVGGLGGAAVSIMIAGEAIPPRLGVFSVLSGAAIGLGLGTHFTRGWDDDLFEEASFSIRPTSEVDGIEVGVSGRF